MTHYATAQATVNVSAAPRYVAQARAGSHGLVLDEPTSAGGADAGPSPSDLLCLTVAGCTAITLRMYAEKKGWPLREVRVNVAFSGADDGALEREIVLTGDLDAAQRTRLGEIAERTPMTRAVRDGVVIGTEVR